MPRLIVDSGKEKRNSRKIVDSGSGRLPKGSKAVLACIDGGPCDPNTKLKTHRASGGDGDPCWGCGG